MDEIVGPYAGNRLHSPKDNPYCRGRLPRRIGEIQFLKLNSSHIEFVLDCMRENTTKVRNIKQYLKAVLFNAPSTIDSYYTALVNHDLYRRRMSIAALYRERS